MPSGPRWKTKTPLRILAAVPLLLLQFSIQAQPAPADTTSARWEKDIRAFEQADSLAFPPAGAVLFVGSSTIRLWPDIRLDFPGITVIQRGFGGSKISDAIHFAHRIILPYRPRLVVLYAGDNDLAAGQSPGLASANFQTLADTVLRRLPDARLAFLAIKPSVARWHLIDSIREANRQIRDFCGNNPRLVYIDVFTPMLGADGLPRRDWLAEDGLHLNRAGYAAWTSILAPYLQP